ncbi:hypothetical protein J1G42_07525 [Cellulomonas sp. zg-ZUI222]|uniref:General stress protein 17M-like domain-containing protein n=1 Tax=Cellulomonas wangleii TaxID=2816956 RepID=A0ABX8D1H3_9CELL|nr:MULTISPECIES: general stress protein [Cellulomonas]MBO0899812.1 hypothetical protein [Cellulomonas sp. zg-ZUI22]MBO0920674.1 hypothetical protein [Cellulomonas wangleii]MBO0922908.1 hypothetical protein [Cellulomonas wangleii]QVI61305.1 hypothetical protein KG103_12515 [Cellulomonas wangleii]
MSFPQSERIPTTPTLPTGETVATYGTYLQAQKAVELLAEKQFPVRAVTIVGTDLRMVERVIRRLSYPSAALGGFLSGAWFGLFVGLILTLFSTGGASVMLPAVLFGGAFGLLFSVIGYSLTRGRRDFASASQIVATSYSVLCQAEHAHRARTLLADTGGVVSGWPEPVRPPAPPVGAPPSDPRPGYGPPTTPPPAQQPPAPPAQPPAPPAPPSA